MNLSPVLSSLLSGFSTMEQAVAKVGSKNGLVVVIGNTGAGKSTLINYLAGRVFERVQDPVGSKVSCKDPVVQIGQSSSSQTKYPASYQIPSMDLSLCDCPGFYDTHGNVTEVVNAFGLKTIFQTKLIKGVVLCIEYHSLLNMRGGDMDLAIQRTVDCLGADIIARNSLQLLITKAEKDLPDISNGLEALSLRSSFIAELIQKKRVGFYNPVDTEISPNGFMRRADLLKSIGGLTPLPSTIQARVSLSKEAIQYIHQALDWAQAYSRELTQKKSYAELAELYRAVVKIRNLDVADPGIALKLTQYESQMVMLLESFQLDPKPIEELNALLKVLPELKTVIQAILDKCRNRVSEDQGRLQAIDSLNSKIRSLENANSQLASQISSLNSQITQQRTSLESLRSLEQEVQRLRSLEQEVQRLRGENWELSQENYRIKQLAQQAAQQMLQGYFFG